VEVTNLIPEIAKQIGIDPTMLVFLFFAIVKLANVLARFIPSDATGWQGVVRKVCAFIGVYVANRITAGVTVSDVARAALPVTGAISASDMKDALSPDSRARNENTAPAPTRLLSIDAIRSGAVQAPPKRDAEPYTPVVVAGVDITRPEVKRESAESIVEHDTSDITVPNIPGDVLSGSAAFSTIEDAQLDYLAWAAANPQHDKGLAPYLREHGWQFVYGSGWQKKGE